ncbi:MAG: DNA polymerase IV [Nitrospina sp.]|jgi:DNA polymerase IV|nr:DNA polymerase IV [Nitrospina sp.]MBT3508616.1 DNA polymerase IV [Nitrospina sp.]MBT3875640.1 DNA polymerase IV [Nitrospina sp.]MBT4048523.1 DNA polymerase IV [Nitrospina sp.]MBT4558933.1 DNA polymerase IV [Nitrospina sp.]
MNTEPRKILHVDMDAFFVSVEEVLDPSLKGKPVVVGGDPDGRGVVAAASYAVRRYGVHSAMPVAQAKRLCPHAIFLRGSHRYYSEYSAKVFEILKCYSPLVEPMSLDEAFVDLTGCERLHGPVLQTAEKIRNEIREKLGLNASIGIASNKLLAKITSAYCKPNGMLWIAPGMEQRFLAPLPIQRIPGIGPKGGTELRRMGIKSVGDLARLPRELLEEAYGKWGVSLYRKARGISDSPVIGEVEDSRSISRETTLQADSVDPLFLESTLSYLTEKAAGQLREEKLFARTVTLKLRYSDFKTVTRSKTLEMPTAEDHALFKTGVGLFRNLFTRRVRVRLVGIAFTSLTATPYRQEDLFDSKGGRCWDGLYQGIDRIRHKYGFRSILRGTSYRN